METQRTQRLSVRPSSTLSSIIRSTIRSSMSSTIRRDPPAPSSGRIAAMQEMLYQFAGPCAQGVLDTVIVPCPMSLGCSGLIDSIVLFKDNAFLGTSAHESVPLAGSPPAPRRLPAGFPLWVAASPNASGLDRNGSWPCWGESGVSEWRVFGAE